MAFATMIESFRVCDASGCETNMNESSRQPGIELRAVGVRRGERWILRDITWSVPAGSYAAILGPNGSGKSTLARVLAGYIWPTIGDVFIDGHHFGETDLNQL